MNENKKVWDDVFKKQGRVFTEAHPDVEQLGQALQPAAGKHILDLGSGSGRHVIHLAKAGFTVHGFDNAQSGLDMTRQWLQDEALEAELHLGDMNDPLPFEDDFFDAVISIQVIHHGRLEDIEAAIAELARTLKTWWHPLCYSGDTEKSGEGTQTDRPQYLCPAGWLGKRTAPLLL